MNQTLADAMRRSLDLTRSGRLTDATAAIQAALSGSTAEQEAPASTALPPGSRIRPDAPDAEIVEPEIVKPAPRTARSTRQAPKRSLRDVIADLQKRPAAFGAMQGQPAAAPAIPEGARFDRLTHAGPHGSRGYRLYVPAALPDGPQGLVLMLHGCTQTADDFATGTAMNAQAERHGLIVVYPEQTRAENAMACWNWFRAQDQGATSGEAALLADLARSVARDVSVPEGRIFVAGLSAGGAMAAILGNAFPQVFAAVGVHSGIAPGLASDMPSAFAAMRGDGAGRATPAKRPVIVFHGTADTTVAPGNARAVTGPIRDETRRDGAPDLGRHAIVTGRSAAGHPVEIWQVDGMGHAWSGGDPRGSYAVAGGPDASAEMVRFFLAAEA